MTSTKLKQFYIAFSIHATNAFIVAVLKANDLDDLKAKMIAAGDKDSTWEATGSRRNVAEKHADGPDKNGTKILWSGLVKTDTQQPHTNPSFIMKRFKQLEKMGWTVMADKFRARHFKT